MHGHRAVVELLLRRAGSGASGASSSEGASSGASGASGSGAAAGPSGSVEEFMRSSKAELAAREEKTVSGGSNAMLRGVWCCRWGAALVTAWCSRLLGGLVPQSCRPAAAAPPPRRLAALLPAIPPRRPPPAAAAPRWFACPSPSARMRRCQTPSSGRATNSLLPGTMRGQLSSTTSRSHTGPSEPQGM